jgi:hypothetical protein
MGEAYHSSVLVDGVELFFCDTGLVRAPASDGDCPKTEELRSHSAIGSTAVVFEMGASCHSDGDVIKVLGSKFQPGTYDLLRKNCNSFSDCALTYLLGKRLDAKYRQLESLGLSVQSSLPSFLEAASLGGYSPNPVADGFDLEVTVRALSTWSHPCAKAAAKRRAKMDSADSMQSLSNSPLQLATGALHFADWLSDRAADGILEGLKYNDWLADKAADGVLVVVNDIKTVNDIQVH